MSSISVIGLGTACCPRGKDWRRRLRRALAALSLPTFFVTGFALRYASALQAPTPGSCRGCVAPLGRLLPATHSR